MTDLQPSSHAPRPPLSLPTPAELKLRIPRMFRPAASRAGSAGGPAVSSRLNTLLQSLVGLPSQTALLGVFDQAIDVLLPLPVLGPSLALLCDAIMGVVPGDPVVLSRRAKHVQVAVPIQVQPEARRSRQVLPGLLLAVDAALDVERAVVTAGLHRRDELRQVH